MCRWQTTLAAAHCLGKEEEGAGIMRLMRPNILYVSNTPLRCYRVGMQSKMSDMIWSQSSIFQAWALFVSQCLAHIGPASDAYRASHWLKFPERKTHQLTVLQVEEGWPQPDRDAGSVRLDCIFRILLEEGYSITYGTTSHFSYTQPLYPTQMRCLIQSTRLLELQAVIWLTDNLSWCNLTMTGEEQSPDACLERISTSYQMMTHFADSWVWKPGQKLTLNSGL